MRVCFLKLIMCVIFFINVTYVKAQQQITTKGIYRGYDSGYIFSIKVNSSKAEVLTFQEIVPDLLYEFDLKADTQIGKLFNIKYTKTIDNVDEGTEIHYTILGLHLIK